MAALPLIRISPSEFQFTESRSGYTSRLRLTSLQNQAVGFKFKTNAPHKFLVKPVVCSLTAKGMAVDVVVKSTGPITHADRFLIQTVALAANEAENLDSTKWRTLDPARIMEDLIYCTVGGLRRSSVSSQSSGSQSAKSPSLVAVGSVHAFDPSEYTSEKAGHGLAHGLAKRLYTMMPAMDVAEFSWLELVVFAATCFALGFLLPLVRLALF